MCQYCGNTGLCYFVATYGAVWIYKKIVILLKKLKHKENINP